MKNESVKDINILQVFLFVLSVVSIFIFRDYVGLQNIRLINFVLLPLVSLFLIVRRYKLSCVENIYVIGLSVGFILHVLIGVNTFSAIGDSLFARIVPVLLLALALCQKVKPNVFIVFFFLFFIIECGLSIYEKLSLTHCYDYNNIDDFLATSVLMDDATSFRSYSLMLHPLFNANTVSICLAFILCSNHIKGIYKFLLFALGLFALWGFNSRGAMIIWGIILLYRIILYKAKLAYTIIILVVLYFALPPLVEWILFSGYFGRLADFDFTDGSTLTRFEAFDAFQSEKWNFYDILAGGREFCYPGTNLILENGFLLDLGYWGIIVGSIKVICEILITYKAIKYYPIRDKIIIFLAVWGVAFMNNNSYQTWLMPIFVMACICFNSYMPYREK